MGSRIRDEDRYPVGKPLLLKLFSAYQEVVEDGRFKEDEVALYVTEFEAWQMRDVVSPYDDPDGPPVGIRLLRKLHSLLLTFNLPPGEAHPPRVQPLYQNSKTGDGGRVGQDTRMRGNGVVKAARNRAEERRGVVMHILLPADKEIGYDPIGPRCDQGLCLTSRAPHLYSETTKIIYIETTRPLR